jgi:hypothetical protein
MLYVFQPPEGIAMAKPYEISCDSGSEAQIAVIRIQMEQSGGHLGDPLELLILWEQWAISRLRYTRDIVLNDKAYIDAFINRRMEG